MGTPEDEKTEKCWTCGDEAGDLKSCSICYTAQYCSKECQKTDNEGHKKWCSPWMRYKGVVEKFVPSTFGDMDAYIKSWLDRSVELQMCKNALDDTRTFLHAEPEDVHNRSPMNTFRAVYAPTEECKTLGDLIRSMYPDGIVPCDTVLFSQLMIYKPATPLQAFHLDLGATPVAPLSCAMPAHPTLSKLLLDHFSGTGMVYMCQFRRGTYAAMLPDGPIVGSVDAITSAMTAIYVTMGGEHPGGKTVVPGGTYPGFDSESTAGDILTAVMTRAKGITWRTIEPKGG